MAGPSVQEIAQDIVSRARQKGVDPRFALGVAFREGLNPNTINSPTFGNPDAKGYSYGPWQLYSGSPQAGSVAPGGMAAQFMNKYGERPSAANWQQQNDFALGLMAGKNPASLQTTWYAIRDAGGPDAIRSIGEQKMRSLGLMNSAPDTSPSSMAPAGFTPNPAPSTPGQPMLVGAPMPDTSGGAVGDPMADNQQQPDYLSQFSKLAGSMGGGGGGGQAPAPQLDWDFSWFRPQGPKQAQPIQIAPFGKRRGLLG